MEGGVAWSGVLSRLRSLARTWWHSLCGVSWLFAQWLRTGVRDGITIRNRIMTTMSTVETTTPQEEDRSLGQSADRVRPTEIHGRTGCPGPVDPVQFRGQIDCGCGQTIFLHISECWIRRHRPTEMPAILCHRCGRDHGIMVEVILRQEIGRWHARSRALAEMN